MVPIKIFTASTIFCVVGIIVFGIIVIIHQRETSKLKDTQKKIEFKLKNKQKFNIGDELDIIIYGVMSRIVIIDEKLVFEEDYYALPVPHEKKYTVKRKYKIFNFEKKEIDIIKEDTLEFAKEDAERKLEEEDV